jgi:hypothetical protein
MLLRHNRLSFDVWKKSHFLDKYPIAEVRNYNEEHHSSCAYMIPSSPKSIWLICCGFVAWLLVQQFRNKSSTWSLDSTQKVATPSVHEAQGRNTQLLTAILTSFGCIAYLKRCWFISLPALGYAQVHVRLSYDSLWRLTCCVCMRLAAHSARVTNFPERGGCTSRWSS